MHNTDIAGQFASVTHTVQTTSNVHEASLVGTTKHIGAAVDNSLSFFSNDLFGNIRLFYREGTTETAATVSLFHFNIFKAANILQKNQRLFLNTKQTGCMAGFVECYLLIKRCANICYAKNIHNEIGEFIKAICYTLSADGPLWLISKKLHVFMLHCECAGAGKADDGFSIFESFDGILNRSLGSLDVTRVDQRLTTANLFLWNNNLTAETLKHLNSSDTNLWIKHIHHTLGK